LKNLSLQCLSCFAVLFFASAFPSTAQAGAEEEVLATARAITEAFNAGDREAMEKVKLCLTDMHNEYYQIVEV
jgi:hypothetical protein